MADIQKAAQAAMRELLADAKLQAGDIVVVGCSTSEVAGAKIGSDSKPELARELVQAMLPQLTEAGLYLAAQCCEHLNRAIILESQAARLHRLSVVNVLPQPKAGGSFATAVWAAMQAPVAVEAVQAAAGLDIGDTLIGMHLRPVAVPLRLTVQSIGAAHVNAARTRPKFIGGVRAAYNEDLL